MNYKKLYFNIIRNRRENPLDGRSYGEEHHIIPRSFGGGNHKANLVRLTAREHFVVHFLLYKMYKHRSQVLFPNSKIEAERYRKMAYAFNLMMRVKSKDFTYINSHVFEQIKQEIHLQSFKYPKNKVKSMFDFYIQNNLSPKTIDVLNKQFHTDFVYGTLKSLFYKHNLKISDHRECKQQKRYTKEKVEQMFDFYIKNELSYEKIDVLNKQFYTDFVYATLKKLFNRHNLKISDYRECKNQKKHTKEQIKQMFDFYIQNNLSSKTIDILNKKFNKNLTYNALTKLFYKNNLKISEYKGK